jgi:MFS family permease
MSPADTGLLVMLQQAANLSCALGFGYLYDRTRSPFVGAILMGSMAAGFLTYGLFGRDLPYVGLIGVALVLGSSLGGFTTVNNTAVMGLAPREQRGLAAGLVETTRQLGHGIGVSVSSSFMGAALAGAVTPGPEHYVSGFEQAALAMSLLSATGVVTLLWSRSRSRAVDRQARPAEPEAHGVR